jgi:hypothetical protein
VARLTSEKSSRLAIRAFTVAVTACLLAPLVQCKPPDRAGAFGAYSDKQIVGCCTDFRVGYDMMVTDFGVDPSVRPEFAAFAQAMGDLVVQSTRTLDEVTGACKNLALDFGGSTDDRTVVGRSGTEASYAWCNLAARRLQDAFSDALQPAGHFTPHFSPAECWVDAPFLYRCEATCSADAACQERPFDARCDKAQTVGMCNGKCLGTCEGSAVVPASCDGTCDAECEGACNGDCYGTCEGVIYAGGRCRGMCTGTCLGSCKGRCTGVCHYGKGAADKCDGPCKGGCSAPYPTIKCEADLAAPKCPVDPSCELACRAISQARASCSVPSVTIALGDDITKEISADLGIQTKLRTLELNLPKLLSASQARGVQLEGEAKAAFEASNAVLVDKSKGALGKLGLKGSACAGVMQSAGEQALQDFHTAIDCAKTVLKTLPVPRQ